MARTITVTFDDGSTHQYQNAPDDVTPDQVSARANQEFGKKVVHLDGGRATQSVNQDIPTALPQQQAPTESTADMQNRVINQALTENPIAGVVDAAKGAVLGGLAGMGGMMYGAATGIGKNILNGQYFNDAYQASNDVENEAAKYAQKAASQFMPKSEIGNRYLSNAIEAVAPLTDAAAGISPLTSEVNAVAQSAKLAQPVLEATTETAMPASTISSKSVKQAETVNRMLAGDAGKDLAKSELKVVNPELKDESGNLLPEAYKKVDDPEAISAIKNGIDEGAVGLIKTTNQPTVKLMKDMTDISEQSKNDLRYAVDNRPANIIGDQILNDYNHVKMKNKIAGEAIDEEAKNTLRGNQVDVSEPVNNFISALKDEMGITFKTDPDGKISPSFKNSQISGSGFDKDKTFIKKIVNDLYNSGMPDAYNVHNFKRSIDNMVVYGEKNNSALQPAVENSVKKLRNGLDTVLDNNFDAYNKANQDYSTTIKALGDMRDAAGKKLKFGDTGANQQLGILAQTMLGNNKSVQQVNNAITNLQNTARQYGLESPANYKDLVMYSNQLDKRFGSHAPSSLLGNLEKANKSSAELAAKGGLSAATGSKSGLLSTAAEIKNKVLGRTDKDAYDALRKLTLKQANKKEASQ